MFRVQTAYEIPNVDILIGAAFQYLTGKPYGPQANVSLPQGTRQIYTEPLGSSGFNLRRSSICASPKSSISAGDRRIEILADILNLGQEKAEESIITRNFFSENFGAQNTFIDPMRAMIGFKLHF